MPMPDPVLYDDAEGPGRALTPRQWLHVITVFGLRLCAGMVLLALGVVALDRLASRASAAPPPADAQKPLIVAVAFDPVDDRVNHMMRVQGLADPLGAALHSPVRIVNGRSLRSIAAGIRSGAFDVLWVPANLAAAALKDPNMEALGTDGRTLRIAVVATRGIKAFEDAKGETLHLPQEDSPAGYVGIALLSDHGVRLADFRNIYVEGSYEVARTSVAQGVTALTAIPDDAAQQLASASPDTVKVLERSPPIPGNGLVVRKSVPPETKARLATYFAGLAGIPALAPASPTTYKYLTGLSHYTPETWQGLEKVDAARVQALAREGVDVIDVRTQEEYAAKRIPGARLQPYEERSPRAVGVDYSPDRFDVTALPSGSRRVVLYCNGPECWKSFKASLRALASSRFEKVYWFRGGLPEWERAGFPVAR
ncbi:MAG: PhnD/SsuA/transferrin family substrate-binding protein [Rubrivivax sp.]